jgi:hypothetical protein
MTRVRGETPTLEHALEDARALVKRTLSAFGPEHPADERRRRLEPTELPSLMLYAGVLARADRRQREAVLTSLVESRTSQAGPRLKRAELLGLVTTCPAPHDLASQIVERYVLRSEHVTSRARYNVACFYSNLGRYDDAEPYRNRCYDRALSELELALNDATLLSWASHDPSLEPVQRARPRDWAALIERNTPKAHPPASGGGGTVAEQPTESSDVAGERRPLADRMLRRFMRRGVEEGAEVTVDPATGIDYEIRTPRGVILVAVEPRRDPPLRPDDVSRFADHVSLWAAGHEKAWPWRAVLLTGAFAEQDARELAERFGVEIVTVW